MILAIDLAFRNIGWCVFSEKYFVSCGVIKTSDTQIVSYRLNELDKQFYKENYKLPTYHYKNEMYIHTIKTCILILDDIVKGFSPEELVCEVPHSGGMDFRSVSQMAMSISMIASLSALRNYKLIVVQQSVSKKILKQHFNIKETTKQHSVEFAKEKFPDLVLPKQKELQHHIADAAIAYYSTKELLYESQSI